MFFTTFSSFLNASFILLSLLIYSIDISLSIPLLFKLFSNKSNVSEAIYPIFSILKSPLLSIGMKGSCIYLYLSTLQSYFFISL